MTIGGQHTIGSGQICPGAFGPSVASKLREIQKVRRGIDLLHIQPNEAEIGKCLFQIGTSGG